MWGSCCLWILATFPLKNVLSWTQPYRMGDFLEKKWYGIGSDPANVTGGSSVIDVLAWHQWCQLFDTTVSMIPISGCWRHVWQLVLCEKHLKWFKHCAVKQTARHKEPLKKQQNHWTFPNNRDERIASVKSGGKGKCRLIGQLIWTYGIWPLQDNEIMRWEMLNPFYISCCLAHIDVRRADSYPCCVICLSCSSRPGLFLFRVILSDWDCPWLPRAVIGCFDGAPPGSECPWSALLQITPASLSLLVTLLLLIVT